jgi:hypothetical protein
LVPTYSPIDTSALPHPAAIIANLRHSPGVVAGHPAAAPDECFVEKVIHHVMYNGVVARTQIYLGDEELELLDRVSLATGASRSELIRRAVRDTFGEKSKTERLRALEVSAGSWRGRRLTGSEYVDSRRGDLNRRLNERGLQ